MKLRPISRRVFRGRPFSNIAEATQGVQENTTQRQLQHFYKADPAYGEGVAKDFGLDVKLDAAE